MPLPVPRRSKNARDGSKLGLRAPKRFLSGHRLSDANLTHETDSVRRPALLLFTAVVWRHRAFGSEVIADYPPGMPSSRESWLRGDPRVTSVTISMIPRRILPRSIPRFAAPRVWFTRSSRYQAFRYPFERPTLEFWISSTAKILGIEIPEKLVALADTVIE